MTRLTVKNFTARALTTNHMVSKGELYPVTMLGTRTVKVFYKGTSRVSWILKTTEFIEKFKPELNPLDDKVEGINC